jgi:hypothetical protein
MASDKNSPFGTSITTMSPTEHIHQEKARLMRQLMDAQQVAPNKVWMHQENAAYQQPIPFNPKEVHLAVERTENGFILTLAGTKYVAKDADELKDIFITALVALKLETRK